MTVSNDVLFERQPINHHHHQLARPQAVPTLGPDAAAEVPQPPRRGRCSHSDTFRYIFWVYACIFDDAVSLLRRAHPKPLALSDANPWHKIIWLEWLGAW